MGWSVTGRGELWPTRKFKVFCETAKRRCAIPTARTRRAARKGRARQFWDGETRYQILEYVRGADVFVVQPCANPGDLHRCSC